MKCVECGKTIDVREGYYDGPEYYCRDCGDSYIVYAEDIEAYVHEDDYNECYLDDSLSDIETFEWRKEACLLYEELDDNFTFLKTEKYKGISFDIYMDDYGQSYTLAWIDPNTEEISKWCCGTYNGFKDDMEDIADYILRKQ